MWMNLHTLPDGKSMYTVYVTWDDEGTPRSEVCAEEVDFVYKRSAGSFDIPNDLEFMRTMAEMYGNDWMSNCSIIGIVNQSDGYVVYDAFAAGLTTDNKTL